MAYRRTEKIRRRLAERNAAIIAAARELASERGIAAVQIAPVAARAGIAAGTVYRYFPSKAELVRTLVEAILQQEIAAMGRAADAAPGPLSALAAGVAAFAGRAAARSRLAWTLLAESGEPELELFRRAYRKAVAAEIETRIKAAIAAGRLPAQDTRLAASAILGALVEALINPSSPAVPDGPSRAQDEVRAVTLLVLRGLGVADAQARGIVVQTILPDAAERIP